MSNIAHYISSLDVGGTQVFLKNLSSIEFYKEKHNYIIIVEDEENGYFKSYFEKNGFIIESLPDPKTNFIKYIFGLFNIIRKYRIDTIHSHVSLFSGVICFLSSLFNVKKKIVHCHSFIRENNTISRKAYVFFMKKMINIFSDIRLACSDEAGCSLFNKKFEVINNGLYLPDWINSDIKCTNNDKIKISHVGRFVKEKNHEFIIDVFNEITKLNQGAELHLFGDGELRHNIEKKVHDLNLNNNVFFHGNIFDIYNHMKNIDLMIFPSISEGFGLSIIESQALSIPVLVSDNIPKKTNIIPELYYTENLISPINIWVEKIHKIIEKDNKLSSDYITDCFTKSGFNIETSAKKLIDDIY